MNSILTALKIHGTSIQILLFLGVIITVWCIELRVALVSAKDKWRHSSTNLMFIISALPIQLLLTFGVIFISAWVTIHHWGILYQLPFAQSAWIKYGAGFFLMDFFEYIYHITMHKVSSFWRFHLIHHSDLEMDVSTTVREHPGETFIRVCFQMVWVFLAGASMGLLLLRQTVQTFANLIAHTHYKPAERIENIFGLLFITPSLHHVHHHFELPYTDSNYGDVFNIWDRIFGTYRKMDVTKIQFGVDVYKGYSSSKFSALVKFPFIFRYRKD